MTGLHSLSRQFSRRRTFFNAARSLFVEPAVGNPLSSEPQLSFTVAFFQSAKKRCKEKGSELWSTGNEVWQKNTGAFLELETFSSKLSMFHFRRVTWSLFAENLVEFENTISKAQLNFANKFWKNNCWFQSNFSFFYLLDFFEIRWKLQSSIDLSFPK